MTWGEYEEFKKKIKRYRELQAVYQEQYKNKGSRDSAYYGQDNVGQVSKEYVAALKDVVETAKKYGVSFEGADLSGITEDPSGEGSATSNLFGKRHNALEFKINDKLTEDAFTPAGEVETEEGTRSGDYKEPGEFRPPMPNPEAQWWAQDVNNYVGAIDDLNSIRDYYPWMPELVHLYLQSPLSHLYTFEQSEEQQAQASRDNNLLYY